MANSLIENTLIITVIFGIIIVGMIVFAIISPIFADDNRDTPYPPPEKKRGEIKQSSPENEKVVKE